MIKEVSKGLGLSSYPYNNMLKILRAYRHELNRITKTISPKGLIEPRSELKSEQGYIGHLRTRFLKEEDGGLSLMFIYKRHAFEKMFSFPIDVVKGSDVDIASFLLREYNTLKLDVIKELHKNHI